MTDSAPVTHGLQDQAAAPALAAQPDSVDRPCPDGAALIIKGEHFPCTSMRGMAPECDTHDGWLHGNGEVEAIWR
jgi:hypothetical protein